MTKRDLDQLLKRFDDWKDLLRKDVNAMKDLKDDSEVPPERIADLVTKGLQLDPLVTFLNLAPATVAPGPVGVIAPPLRDGNPAAGDEPPAASFDDFMASMARSMVATQTSLDLQSARYLASIENQPHIQPHVFRVPKLEAQLKFGLTLSEKSKINLLFWGKDKERSELNQQGINFEIVSVPAPPGALASARQSLVFWNLILDPAQRDTLLDQLQATPPNPLTRPVLDAAANEPNSIAFMDLGDGKRNLVLFAQSENEKDVGLWLLTITGAGASLEAVYRFNKNLGPEEVTMRNLVLELASQQARISGT